LGKEAGFVEGAGAAAMRFIALHEANWHTACFIEMQNLCFAPQPVPGVLDKVTTERGGLLIGMQAASPRDKN
jgi:hypothetical protein